MMNRGERTYTYHGWQQMIAIDKFLSVDWRGHDGLLIIQIPSRVVHIASLYCGSAESHDTVVYPATG